MNPTNRFLSTIRKQPMVALLLLLLLLLGGVVVAFLQGQDSAREHVEASFDRSSISRRNLLQRDVQNPLLVPEVLATSRMVRSLLVRPDPAVAKEQNVVLEETARNTQVDVLYVMDLNGNCVAASNWRAADSFVGKNYKFRPYFKEAVAGQTGRYVAKGVTSAKVGYYLARPVSVEGAIVGVVVAKISFGALQARIEEFWRMDKELNLVADEHGVVFISPLPAFMFKSTQPIAEATRKEIEDSRQYGGALAAISMTPGKVLADQLRFVEFADLPGQSFLQKAYYFQELGLWLYLQVPASRYWRIVGEFTAMFSLLALVIFLICLGLYQRSVYGVKLIEAAIRDPLTGLHTRLYMVDWCEAAIRSHNRDPRAGFGVVIFDLDWFKQVNDKYGHMAGDDVLRRVGQIISGTVRPGDLAVRFGGEELALFAHCRDQGELAALAERIRLAVEQTEFKSRGERIPVTVSAGVAYHMADETMDILFARSDDQLYKAKDGGRNRICS